MKSTHKESFCTKFKNRFFFFLSAAEINASTFFFPCSFYKLKTCRVASQVTEKYSNLVSAQYPHAHFIKAFWFLNSFAKVLAAPFHPELTFLI